ncbi:hypothetical protein PIB30_059875 [Stylosanthes scabra]|uniref:Uncharacterized protein n=1 Tax=Stylosanthes scabra TaxID=79078 RepID=A0ABU6UJ66_9FABA|nr:hypothetical protein [Stylosanthes scabra]
MKTNNRHPITDNIILYLKGGVITNKIGGIHLNNHNKPNSANHTHTANHKTHKTQDINHLMLEKLIHHQMPLHPTMRETQKRFESQLSHITDLLHKFTNQPTIDPQSQPSTSSPLPSQPLPNPKGGINMVHNEVAQEEEEEDEEEGEDDWLYELLAELASSDDSDDEEAEEAEEIVDKQDEEETFFIATIFGGGKKVEYEIPIKCEDPGPLKKSKEVFTMVDASIVFVAGIAEDGLVKVGELTISVDFHVIMPTKDDKGGRPQVMLGRPFLKIAGFKLQYDDDTFTFSVGKITETFPVTPPPTPRKKGVHHFQICEEGTRKISVMMEARGKEKECRKKEGKPEKGSRITPPPLKKKENKEGSNPTKKKKKHEEVKSRKKKKHKEDEDEEIIALKCSSFGNLLGKLKKIGKALRNNQKMDAHLVKDQSKWK